MQNLPFLDPTEYIDVSPDIIEDVLEVGCQATVCEFNRRGTLIAVGTSDGRVFVFDFETRSLARWFLDDHLRSHPITSLSWSANGRNLMTSSTDGQVLVYDVLSSRLERRFQFEIPIFFTQFHPRKSSLLLICPMAFRPPFLVDLNQVHSDVSSLDNTPRIDLSVPMSPSAASSFIPGIPIVKSGNSGQALEIFSETAARFVLPDSSRIFVAYRDTAFLFDASSPSDPPLVSLALPAAVSDKNTGKVKRFFGSHIALSGSSRRILLNCNFDRSLRLIWVGDKELRIEREIQDSVTREAFRCCTFSVSPRFFSSTRTLSLEEEESEYIVACTTHNFNHFSLASGIPQSILSPPGRESFLDIKFNPTSARPLLVTASSGGVAYVWGRSNTGERGWERWISGMKEIGENRIHQEREDEFDEICVSAENQDADDGLLIDITSVEKSWFSDDEIDSELVHLPTDPELVGAVPIEPTVPEEKKKRPRKVKSEDQPAHVKPKKVGRKPKKHRSFDHMEEDMDDEAQKEIQREKKRARDRKYQQRKRARLAAAAALLQSQSSTTPPAVDAPQESVAIAAMPEQPLSSNENLSTGDNDNRCIEDVVVQDKQSPITLTTS